LGAGGAPASERLPAGAAALPMAAEVEPEDGGLLVLRLPLSASAWERTVPLRAKGGEPLRGVLKGTETEVRVMAFTGFDVLAEFVEAAQLRRPPLGYRRDWWWLRCLERIGREDDYCTHRWKVATFGYGLQASQFRPCVKCSCPVEWRQGATRPIVHRCEGGRA